MSHRNARPAPCFGLLMAMLAGFAFLAAGVEVAGAQDNKDDDRTQPRESKTMVPVPVDKIKVDDGEISEYRVNMKVTFVLKD